MMHVISMIRGWTKEFVCSIPDCIIRSWVDTNWDLDDYNNKKFLGKYKIYIDSIRNEYVDHVDCSFHHHDHTTYTMYMFSWLLSNHGNSCHYMYLTIIPTWQWVLIDLFDPVGDYVSFNTLAWLAWLDTRQVWHAKRSSDFILHNNYTVHMCQVMIIMIIGCEA